MKYVAYVLLLGAAPALAQNAPSANSASAAPATAAKTADRVICRTIEETGSRLGGKRVCMTQLQWDEQRRQARDDIEEGLRHKH